MLDKYTRSCRSLCTPASCAFQPPGVVCPTAVRETALDGSGRVAAALSNVRIVCSMAKLFDLVVMGVKMVLVVSTNVNAPYTVALVQLRCVRAILASTPPEGEPETGSSLELLDSFTKRLSSTYGHLQCGTWISIRSSLLSFFEERRVKVRPQLSCT